MAEFKTTIGLEIHVQLATKSKMFCRCNNDAHEKAPNTTVCPRCLGMPGMLPVANKTAIEWTIKTGLAMNSRINKLSKFDRKHYFYPDLPKGYQISQYDQPLCLGGKVEVKSQILNHKSQTNSNIQNSNIKTIKLNRIHLEEDAGKLIHKDGASFVDLNRAGTPLMEIVTEPDISSPAEAAEFLRKLQKIVRDVVKVSEASMEKGHLRCDANIDVKDENGKMSPIVEIKNLNSFKFVQKALEFEAKRLADEYSNWPEKKSKVTRGFNSQTGETYEQRIKEEASDYRYFPEPDLPPIDTTKLDLESFKSDISEGEEERIAKLVKDGVSESDAKVLVQSMTKYDIYVMFSKFDIPKNYIAKIVVQNYFGFELDDEEMKKIDEYLKAIKLLYENKVSKNRFQQICQEIKTGKKLSDINTEEKVDLEAIINRIIADNQSEVERYKNGDKKLFGYFIGQVMKKSCGKVDPKEASEIIKKRIS